MTRDPATGSAKDRLREAVKKGEPITDVLLSEAEAEHRAETKHHVIPTGHSLIKAIFDEAGEPLPPEKGTAKEGGHGNPVGPRGEYEAQAHQTAREGDVETELEPATAKAPEVKPAAKKEKAAPTKKK